MIGTIRTVVHTDIGLENTLMVLDGDADPRILHPYCDFFAIVGAESHLAGRSVFHRVFGQVQQDLLQFAPVAPDKEVRRRNIDDRQRFAADQHPAGRDRQFDDSVQVHRFRMERDVPLPQPQKVLNISHHRCQSLIDADDGVEGPALARVQPDSGAVANRLQQAADAVHRGQQFMGHFRQKVVLESVRLVEPPVESLHRAEGRREPAQHQRCVRHRHHQETPVIVIACLDPVGVEQLVVDNRRQHQEVTGQQDTGFAPPLPCRLDQAE